MSARLRLPAFAAAAAATACGSLGTVPPANTARDGITIALYSEVDSSDGGDSYAVVDDRRWVDVAGDSLVIDRVGTDVALQSLVIEPLAGGALAIGGCARERLTVDDPAHAGAEDAPELARMASVLRCQVHGEPGRYLVRVVYVSYLLTFHAQQEIELTAADRATVASRFVIATPVWHARAELVLFHGGPGGSPARELARGMVALDGSTAVLAPPRRAVPAQLRRIFEGAVHPADEAVTSALEWGRESQPAVWVWLELADRTLPSGQARVHLELPGEPVRDLDVPAVGRRATQTGVRLPLWIDDQLRGKRERWTRSEGDAVYAESFQFAVANVGGAARDVWIDEQLRPARSRQIARAWPGEPVLGHNTLRMKLAVPPGATARAGFDVRYESY